MRAVACLLALALALACCTVVAAATPKAELRIAATAPLLVAGSAFRAGELVRVQAVGAFGARTARVRSSSKGSFTLRFSGLSANPCVLRRVVATGALGSRAVLRLPPGACVDG